MFQHKLQRKSKHTFYFSLTLFFENRAFNEIMWMNIVEPERPQMIICRMRISRWVPNATDTHSECVIFFVFPLQQWLHERSSVLYYAYIASLVLITKVA